MRRAALVLNPAKTTDPDRLMQLLQRRCAELDLPEATVHETSVEDAGHGAARKALAAGADVVLASGGDGTVRAVAAALADSGAALAVVPQGTGNLLARNLDLPLEFEDAVELALTGPRRTIDLGEVAGDPAHSFAVMAGIGFDAAMMRHAPEGLKGALGWPAYVVGGARSLGQRRMRVSIVLDSGEAERQQVRTVLIGNVGRLQGGLELLPDAEPDDGVLDVAVIDPRRVWDWPVLIARVLLRRSGVDKRYHTYRAGEVVVRADQPQPRQVDGELIDDGAELRVAVRPGVLVVCAPEVRLP